MRKLWVLAAIVGVLCVPARATASVPPLPAPQDFARVAVADRCDGLIVATNGWPAGSDGIVGFGSAPPWAAPINTTATYTTSETGVLAWYVLVRGPGQPDQRFSGDITCDAPKPPVAVEPPATTEPEPVVDPAPVVALWADVALAPPW